MPAVEPGILPGGMSLVGRSVFCYYNRVLRAPNRGPVVVSKYAWWEACGLTAVDNRTGTNTI
jgi:hypothetical protein